MLYLLFFFFDTELPANCHVNDTSLLCLLKANESESCTGVDGNHFKF